MGGRRAKSLSQIVGEGLGRQQASFMRAVGENDPEGIATSSAELAAESGRITDILYYASKLADFVIKEAESAQDLNHDERLKLVRREWSRIKKKENIKDDPVITDAIVFAAAKAIGKGRK
jgi:hypothetical protein